MTEYDDIIHLPHPEPRHHQRMTMLQRAAQFAPFAALTGHNEAVRQTARKWEEDEPFSTTSLADSD